MADADVAVRELDDHTGQPALEVRAGGATYVLHRFGGGLASLLDPDGREWVGYRPGGGSAGEYRGIPNTVHPGMGFHPGGEMCDTRPSRQTEAAAEFETGSNNGGWACRWAFTPACATMTLTAAAGPYWWLYEGTPGGAFDAESFQIVDANGHAELGGATWQRRLPEPRGVGIVSQRSPHALLLLDRTERAADVVDSYWPMKNNMTVLGFGRELGGAENPRWRHLTETPATLVIAFREVDAAGVPDALRALATG